MVKTRAFLRISQETAGRTAIQLMKEKTAGEGMGMERRKMSVIVPCYNEEEVLSEFMRELGAVCDRMTQYTFEWIFVDDGSSDPARGGGA